MLFGSQIDLLRLHQIDSYQNLSEDREP
jgi:hypothetical protein